MTCAVVNVDADSVIQRTMYYASGVLMATSSGRDEQPYLYNGKEFVEAHGWHTYNYGFRGYYAPIGRFTSIDPLAESTPWQSPYSYANNNFINNIDWMGLGGMYGGMTSYNIEESACHYIVIEGGTGIVLDYDLDDDDRGVYVYWGDNWEIGGDRNSLTLLGWHKTGLGVSQIMGDGGIINFNAGIMESYACVPQDVICMPNQSLTAHNVAKTFATGNETASSFLGYGVDVKFNRWWWIGRNGELYLTSQVHTRGGYAYSRKVVANSLKGANKTCRILGEFGIGFEVLEVIIDHEIKPSNAINSTMTLFAILTGGTVPFIYFASDIAFKVMTGESLSEKADKQIGTLYKW